MTMQLNTLVSRHITVPTADRTALGQPIFSTTETPVWARRMDFRSRDFLQSTTAGVIGVTSTRFMVRPADPPWRAGDILVDQEDTTWTVQGVGRAQQSGQYEELLATAVGA